MNTNNRLFVASFAFLFGCLLLTSAPSSCEGKTTLARRRYHEHQKRNRGRFVPVYSPTRLTLREMQERYEELFWEKQRARELLLEYAAEEQRNNDENETRRVDIEPLPEPVLFVPEETNPEQWVGLSL